MTFEDIQEIIAKDEHRCLELKKTTGELQDGMHSACAFLNTEGGLLIFGVAPTSLKILGQQVTDSTQREIAQALAGLYPAVEVKPEYIDVPGRNGDQLIVMHFSGWRWGQMPYTYRVEIENPGRLPFDLTPETIKSAHASYPYNPLIAEVLFKSSFLESWGSGVGRMVDACRAQGVPEPEYEVAGGFVRIVFRRPEGAGVVNGDVNGDDRVNDSRNDSLSDSVNGTYQAIKANPGIQRKRISELTGKSIPTIDRHIALLAKSNLIEHRDSDKTGGYYVKKDEDRG
jgi:predicted HTH transcriptional regulator